MGTLLRTSEPIVWVSGLVQCGFDICLYGFSTFLPVIIKQLGYSTINSQLLTAPIYFCERRWIYTPSLRLSLDSFD